MEKNVSQHLAKHLREVFFGGNWTWVNYRDVFADITFEQAQIKREGFHSIFTLQAHTFYFISVQLNAFKTGNLTGSDKESFNLPAIQDEAAWRAYLQAGYAEVEELAGLLETLSHEQLWEPYYNEKYGNWYRNIAGNIEHLHYHLGQIVMLKKMRKG